MPGRNEPCPCGSGKKYKKCCLLTKKDEEPTPPVRELPDSVASRDEPRLDDLPALPNTKPVVPPDPDQVAVSQFWDEFESADPDDRVEKIREVMEDEVLFDAEGVIEYFDTIFQDTTKTGNWDRFRELVEEVRQRRPDVFDSEAIYLLSWAVDGSLSAEQFEEARPLAVEMGERIGSDLDLVYRTFDRLAYHGELETLVEAYRRGWPGVSESEEIFDWAISEYAEQAVRYELFRYVEQSDEPNSTDPALLERVHVYFEEPNPEYLDNFVETLAGRRERTWTLADFEPPAKGQKKRNSDDSDESDVSNLWDLSLEFLRYLRVEEGFPYTKGDMARWELCLYFGKRKSGDLEPSGGMFDSRASKKRPIPKPAHPLCPDRRTLDVALGEMMGVMSGKGHRAVAMFEAIPAWLRFLRKRRLLDEKLQQQTRDQLLPLQADLRKGVGKATWRTALARALEAWPEDSARFE